MAENESNEPSDRLLPEERALLERYQAGDDSAFEELILPFETAIFNFGLRMCGNREDAQDVLQETFINAMRYLKGFRGEAKLRNWLFRIASSVCQKKHRRSKFAPEKEISLTQFYDDGDGPEELDVADERRLPDAEVLGSELGQRLNEAIEGLPKKYRVVLILRDIEGLSAKEVAEILDMSVPAVKSRLHRARLFVRQQLQPYLSGRPVS
ncbi:MAG: sigma-70 family RNA polymerase sigma factor [Nitrospirae bacterium]|nr:MAG: sigma-70 family RNA polymerase sigma factor [Nitrospirota bacterium]